MNLFGCWLWRSGCEKYPTQAWMLLHPTQACKAAYTWQPQGGGIFFGGRPSGRRKTTNFWGSTRFNPLETNPLAWFHPTIAFLDSLRLQKGTKDGQGRKPFACTPWPAKKQPWILAGQGEDHPKERLEHSRLCRVLSARMSRRQIRFLEVPLTHLV